MSGRRVAVPDRYPDLLRRFEAAFVTSEEANASVLGTDEAKWAPAIRHVASSLRPALLAKWRDAQATPASRWASLLAHGDYVQGRIVLSFLWPRIDARVTAQTKHLLKLPFCVHPDTGCVCVSLPGYVAEASGTRGVVGGTGSDVGGRGIGGVAGDAGNGEIVGGAGNGRGNGRGIDDFLLASVRKICT